jgi:hypothetical protein
MSGAGDTSGFVFPGYSSYVNLEQLYAKYGPLMSDKTQEQKEDYLIELVFKGELTADQALMLAIRERIDLVN